MTREEPITISAAALFNIRSIGGTRGGVAAISRNIQFLRHTRVIAGVEGDRIDEGSGRSQASSSSDSRSKTTH